MDTNQIKQTTQNTAKNYPGFVAFYNTKPRNVFSLFLVLSASNVSKLNDT